MSIRQKPAEKVWSEFQEQEKLTDEQLVKFQKYEALLTEWNRKMNLTAINNLSEMVQRHFRDSLALRNCEDLGKIKSITDVGAGAGFPSIPLKIMFPHLGIVLLEVRNKKQTFLKELIKVLELEKADANIFFNLGVVFSLKQKPEKAVEYFLKVIDINPGDAVAHFLTGEQLLKLGEEQEGKRHINKAMKLDPYNKNFH